MWFLDATTSRKKSLDELNKNIINIKTLNESEKSKLLRIQGDIANKQEILNKTNQSNSELNKEKVDSNFAFQNWQSSYNQFISLQQETINKKEIELKLS